MKIIISERQYRIIAEQTNDVDWLIDWFKKVPEEKLKKTFTVKDDKGVMKSMSRNEILNLLSDKSRVVVVNDPEEIKQLGGSLAFFRNNWDPKYSRPEDKKYLGKVVINGNWKDIIKKNPMYRDVKGLDDLKHHEQTHLLQYQQRDNKEGEWKAMGSKIISGFCKNNPASVCNQPSNFGYYQRTDEIYSHLFTLRELLGIQPEDTVIDADAIVKNKVATINVSVNRNGNRIKLPTKTMNAESSTFITIYCCNKSFKQTLTYLHNTLAKSDKQNKSDFDKMV
jgi:hypothetical protein